MGNKKLSATSRKGRGAGSSVAKTVITDMLVSDYEENKAAYDKMTPDEQEEWRGIIGEDLGPGFEQSGVLVGLAMDMVDDDQFESMLENMDNFLDRVTAKYA